MEGRLQQALDRRRAEGTLRSLKTVPQLQHQQETPDFNSNDYLGLARCCHQHSHVLRAYTSLHGQSTLGATGSRLLSGDSVYCRKLEQWLARLHNRPSCLITNSGYDANLCITSCLPVDVIVMDELCHNSIVFGVRWNSRQHHTTVETFAHNCVHDLRTKLQQYSDMIVLVIVESVYSMDGDVAPLQQVLDLCEEVSAQLVVDEAHGLGIYGRTNRGDLPRELRFSERTRQPVDSNAIGGTGVLAALDLEDHPGLLCSVHTFGKAAGCHGAVICCGNLLREYLLNYARPFIYSTALPLHSLVTIRCAYETMIRCEDRRRHVFELVRLFQQLTRDLFCVLSLKNTIAVCPSDTPIQALLVPGNDDCVQFCRIMWRNHSIILYPIRAPTVLRGKERVRVILHAHNTCDQVKNLVECMGKALVDMGLCKTRSKL